MTTPLSPLVYSPPLNQGHIFCGTCNKQFTRSEHLKRHVLTHSKQRSFRCEQCDKEFLRKDSLVRHTAIHQATGPTLLKQGARACLSCASAKIRCSGEKPVCFRCQERNIMPCTYPELASVDNRQVHMDPVSSSPASNVRQATILPAILPAESRPRFGNFNLPEEPQQRLGASVNYSQPTIDQFDQTFWDSTMLSSINWLSNDDQVYSIDVGGEGSAGGYSFPFQCVPQVPPNNLHESRPVNYSGQLDAFETPSALQSHRETISHGPSLSPEVPMSHNSFQSEDHREGEFYVDGQAARLPKGKRRRLNTITSPATTASAHDGFSLSVGSVMPQKTGKISHFEVPRGVYESLVDAFNQICLNRSDTLPTQNHVHSTEVPPASVVGRVGSSFSSSFSVGMASKDVFEHLIASYVEFFHDLLPIFHHTDFNALSWQATIAVCAIGAHFVEIDGFKQFTVSIHEFLRRLLHLADEDENWLPQSETVKAQIRLLHVIGTSYSKVQITRAQWNGIPTRLAKFCLRRRQKSMDLSGMLDRDSRWQRWKEEEICHRVSYAIWMLDCMSVIHSQEKSLFKLEDALEQMPCHETLWIAPSSEEWERRMASYPSVGSLNQALQKLYIHKNLLPSTGEFSRILLIHGLFRRLWDVEAYFRQPMSQWTPSAEKPTGDPLSSDTTVWLPAVPTFTKWRNSSCDCLDILHWSANAAIGAASGLEHPTVLHLHFARVVLLTPHVEIVRLALWLAKHTDLESDDEVSACQQAVRKWAVYDQYKARLAMIHAGVLFWHIRRYSANGFYEPSSVAIATLALWAFSAFSDKPKSMGTNGRGGAQDTGFRDGSDVEDESMCNIILLDRPTDDELVQHFVKDGFKMRANMTGVGDLYGKYGPERVLIQGKKLLETLTCWDITDYWCRILDKLISVTRDQHQRPLH